MEIGLKFIPNWHKKVRCPDSNSLLLNSKTHFIFISVFLISSASPMNTNSTLSNDNPTANQHIGNADSAGLLKKPSVKSSAMHSGEGSQASYFESSGPQFKEMKMSNSKNFLKEDPESSVVVQDGDEDGWIDTDCDIFCDLPPPPSMVHMPPPPPPPDFHIEDYIQEYQQTYNEEVIGPTDTLFSTSSNWETHCSLCQWAIAGNQSSNIFADVQSDSSPYWHWITVSLISLALVSALIGATILTVIFRCKKLNSGETCKKGACCSFINCMIKSRWFSENHSVQNQSRALDVINRKPEDNPEPHWSKKKKCQKNIQSPNHSCSSPGSETSYIDEPICLGNSSYVEMNSNVDTFVDDTLSVPGPSAYSELQCTFYRPPKLKIRPNSNAEIARKQIKSKLLSCASSGHNNSSTESSPPSSTYYEVYPPDHTLPNIGDDGIALYREVNPLHLKSNNEEGIQAIESGLTNLNRVFHYNSHHTSPVNNFNFPQIQRSNIYASEGMPQVVSICPVINSLQDPLYNVGSLAVSERPYPLSSQHQHNLQSNMKTPLRCNSRNHQKSLPPLPSRQTRRSMGNMDNSPQCSNSITNQYV